MVNFDTIRQTPLGPTGVVTPGARSISRVSRTKRGLPFLGRFPCLVLLLPVVPLSPARLRSE
jgi:hypothetical protein